MIKNIHLCYMECQYNHNFLFLGRFYPKGIVQSINENSKGKVGFSNHNFELSIIYGLEQLAINLRVLTVPEVYSWPHNNKKIHTKSECYNDNVTPIKSAGFLNVFIVNKISVLLSVFLNLLKQYRQYNGNQVHVIANAPNVFLLLALKFSRLFTKKCIDVTVIIPDIPSMVSQIHERKGIKGKIVGWLDKYSTNLLGRCERHVLLTEAMTEFFDKPIRHIVMEGLIDERKYSAVQTMSNPDNRIILYTGSVHRQFGIMNLVEAFKEASLPDDVELWICGSGDCSANLKKISECNNRIKFLGLVDSNTARDLQLKAAMLANPRTSDRSFTKYSFPSKTLEYMMTGKPVVMNRLPGIPEEYFNYVITPKDESIHQWAVALSELMSERYEESISKGVHGREFVLNNKNAKKQMKRVVEFITDEK